MPVTSRKRSLFHQVVTASRLTTEGIPRLEWIFFGTECPLCARNPHASSPTKLAPIYSISTLEFRCENILDSILKCPRVGHCRAAFSDPIAVVAGQTTVFDLSQ